MKFQESQELSKFLAPAKGVFDILPDAVTVISSSGKIIYANPSAAKFLDYPLEELIGRKAEDISESISKDILKIFTDGQPQIGVRDSINGKLYITSRLPLRMDGKIRAVISFFQGVFSYDKFALELESYKQMAKLLDAIMEFSYDGLWIMDKHGNVVKLNKAAERITGVTAEEALGRNVADLMAAGYVNKSVTLEVLKRKTTVTLVQTTKLNKKVLATGSPIFNSKGEIDVIIINDRDITELDRMREELKDSKALIELYRNELSDLQLRELESNYYFSKSKVMESVYEKALQVAPFDSTVLLTGESGVGKGFLAKLIHQKSKRNNRPFVRVDCSAIVETLFESEFFGYEKGAFTGAGAKGKMGLAEMADGGTLFLDEISEIPPHLQVKLLRFLEDKCFMRVGGSALRQVDIRVITATNRELGQEVKEGRFRKDLFYRLNVVTIHIPPLKGRTQDIIDLVTFFLNKFCQKHDLKKSLDQKVIDKLIKHTYQGNIRELQNIVESMIIMSKGTRITLKDLPSELASFAGSNEHSIQMEKDSLQHKLSLIEAEEIQKTIQKYGSQREAARHLGINQSTISRKLRKPVTV